MTFDQATAHAVERAAVIIRQRHGTPWAVTWKYVSSGKALHAFLGDMMVPVCGERALRGPLDRRREPAWIEHTPGTGKPIILDGKTHHGGVLFPNERRHRHGLCAALTVKRQDEIQALMRDLQRSLVAQILAGEL